MKEKSGREKNQILYGVGKAWPFPASQSENDEENKVAQCAALPCAAKALLGPWQRFLGGSGHSYSTSMLGNYLQRYGVQSTGANFAPVGKCAGTCWRLLILRRCWRYRLRAYKYVRTTAYSAPLPPPPSGLVRVRTRECVGNTL